MAKALEGLAGVRKVSFQKGSTVIAVTRERGKPTDPEIVATLDKLSPNFAPRKVN